MNITIKNKKLFLFLLITIAVIVIDQVSKLLARWSLPVIKNTGAAFGIFQNSTVPLIWISVIVIGLILYFYNKIPEKKSVIIYIAFILGGTIGNLFDRIVRGYVTDFINLKVWPAFNIADAAITVGVIGLILYLIRKNK